MYDEPDAGTALTPVPARRGRKEKHADATVHS